MRSRFTAYALGDEAYLLASWHASTRPPSVPLDPDLRWTRLEVLEATGSGMFDAEGTVVFRAYAVRRGVPEVLAERSLFRRVQGQWRYVRGL